MRRRRSMAAVLGVAAVVSASLPMTTSAAAGAAIVNGDFETDAVGSTTVTGWTTLDGLVDLGVTQLGGCTSVDTSNYSVLRDWDDNVEPLPIANIPVGAGNELFAIGTTDPVWLDEFGAPTTVAAPGARQVFYGTVTDFWGDEITDFYVVDGSDNYAVWDVYELTNNDDFADGFDAGVYPDYTYVPDPEDRADDVAPASDLVYWDDAPEFGTSTVDASTAADSSLAPTSAALELTSGMNGNADEASGYVAHGPAAVSDAFTTTGAKTIKLDWAASGDEDDYHVLGYALNVDTCQQIEVLDSTGESSAWQTTSVALPAAGTYRFVFVAGTYDATWGQAAGAILYVDNIRAVPTITGTGIDLEPLFGLGDPVANAPIQLTGGGLKPNSPWKAELHSTPVTLATGVTDGSGNFWMLSNLPATVTPGKHQIILSGIAPDGSPRVDTVWITVSAAGTVGYFSLTAEEGAAGVDVDEASLATTGLDLALPLALAAGLAVAGGAALVGARQLRRRS